MPATCHICCDDEAVARRINDTINANDRDDDDSNELDEQTIARLEKRKVGSIYFRTMRKSYAAKT